MKVFEIINLNRGLLDFFIEAGIHVDDVRYIELYKEYVCMNSQGDKVSYIVATLAEKYKISERKVYALIKHFQSELNVGAA